MYDGNKNDPSDALATMIDEESKRAEKNGAPKEALPVYRNIRQKYNAHLAEILGKYDEIARLSEKIVTARARNDGNAKGLEGAAELHVRTLVEKMDKYIDDAGREGEVVQLAKTLGKTYREVANAKDAAAGLIEIYADARTGGPPCGKLSREAKEVLEELLRKAPPSRHKDLHIRLGGEQEPRRKEQRPPEKDGKPAQLGTTAGEELGDEKSVTPPILPIKPSGRGRAA
jgi:hypothetical protein